MKIRELERNPFTRLEMVELPTHQLYYRVVNNHNGSIAYQNSDYNFARNYYVANEPRS